MSATLICTSHTSSLSSLESEVRSSNLVNLNKKDTHHYYRQSTPLREAKSNQNPIFIQQQQEERRKLTPLLNLSSTPAMAELTQSEVYPPKTIWRAFMTWLAFLFQVFVQIVRGVPSIAQVLSFSSSSSDFKALPVVEIPLTDSSSTSLPDTVNNEVSVGGGDQQCLDKLTLVLDLDETLVCAYETSSLPIILRNQATEAGLKWFELECVSVEKEYDGKPKVNHVTVFERPGLRDFLKQTSEFADLVLFTAGLEGYARPLVDRIDTENRIGLRLYRPSTISTQYREHVKDLSCLSKNLSRTVIVDNNPFSFLLQPLNGIPCVPFSAGQPYDNQLSEVLLPLLRHLSLQKDVRPVLQEKFQMPEWFLKHGIPIPGWT